MPANDDVKSRRARIQVECLAIVEHVHVDTARFSHRCFRERFRPVRGVHISAHGYDRGNGGERFQDGGIAHVTGMNDQVRATERLQRLFAQQSMSI